MWHGQVCAVRIPQARGMSAPQHFLQIEGDMAPVVVCTAPDDAPCHMACVTCEETCYCDTPIMRKLGWCNLAEWLNSDDAELLEIGSGVALLPIDVKWEGDYYSWSFVKPVTS